MKEMSTVVFFHFPGLLRFCVQPQKEAKNPKQTIKKTTNPLQVPGGGFPVVLPLSAILGHSHLPCGLAKRKQNVGKKGKALPPQQVRPTTPPK